MKKFLRKHMNALLAVFALALLVFIVAYFGWGIGIIIFEINEANHSQITTTPPPDFDLKGAAGLDYRGIMAPTATNGTTTGQ